MHIETSTIILIFKLQLGANCLVEISHAVTRELMMPGCETIEQNLPSNFRNHHLKTVDHS